MMHPAIAELAQLDQWVNWKVITRNGKKDKPPYSPWRAPDSPPCSHSNPEDWSDYATAIARASLFAGIGFVFSEHDPYSGVDMDGCRDPESGSIEPWAQRWIDLLDSYTEISPSETGVKIFVRGTLPKALLVSMGEHIGIEVYSAKRYFTLTGQHLPGTPTDIRDAQSVLDAMVREYTPAPELKPQKAYQTRQGAHQAGRQNARDVIDGLNQANDLGDYLEDKGAALVHTNGDRRYYSGLYGEQHSHRFTYVVSPADDGAGDIGYSYSPNGKLNKNDFARGFRYFDAVCALEYGGNTLDTLKALNPIQARQPRQETPGEALSSKEGQRRAKEAQRRREMRQEARQQEAAEIRADVIGRASQDDGLTASDRAVLDTLLIIASDRGWCRPSKDRIAEMCGYSIGSVKRSLRRLEARGYFASEGAGGASNQTAIRTFLRGSLQVDRADEMIHESISIESNIESIACEGGPPLPATTEQVPQQPSRRDLLTTWRDLARQVNEPRWYLADVSIWCDADIQVEIARLQALAAAPASEYLASYNPGLDWTAGGRLDLADVRDPREIAAPVIVQLESRVLAPPLSSDPAFGEFIWRHKASQPGAINSRTKKPWTNAQRQRFKREAESLLVETSPEDAALRWDALNAPRKPAHKPRMAPIGRDGLQSPPLTSSFFDVPSALIFAT